MIIPTDGGLAPGDAKWEPMREWLVANLFDLDWIPTDAWICIRDELMGVTIPCMGVEMFTRDNAGRMIWAPDKSRPPTRVEWHPMVQSPPPALVSEI
jgi:hypothetical protein